MLATGAEYRRLPVDDLDDYEGISVFYAAGPPEAQRCGAQRVGVVGGGNSAAQAAIWLARGGALVTLLHRRADLARDDVGLPDRRPRALRRRGPRPQRDRRAARRRRRARGGHADRRRASSRSRSCSSSSAPRRAPTGSATCIARDEKGFVLTGAEAGAEGLLETSVPGVYAAGDVRSGSIKRCATAVGEGATVVRFVHEHMNRAREEHGPAPPSWRRPPHRSIPLRILTTPGVVNSANGVAQSVPGARSAIPQQADGVRRIAEQLTRPPVPG